MNLDTVHERKQEKEKGHRKKLDAVNSIEMDEYAANTMSSMVEQNLI